MAVSYLFHLNIALSCIVTMVNTAPYQFDPMGDALEFFNKSDPMSITWYHAANSIQHLNKALAGNDNMLESDVILRFQGHPNQTNEPIMAHPPAIDSDNTLDNWLNNVLEAKNKGIKLDFKSNEVVEPSLKMLRSKQTRIQHPVWLNSDVLKGPGSDAEPMNPQTFIKLVNEIFPRATLSLGWTTECCAQMYTQAMMDSMWILTRNLMQPVTFPVRCSLLKGSWPVIKSLLYKDPARFTLTVWASYGVLDWEGASPYDMLYVRNDCPKKFVFYDLPGPKFYVFKQLSRTAGSPLNYFALKDWDAIEVTWAHAVNSKDKLENAIKGDVMMLEADVILRGRGTENQTDIPVMGHPPDTDSDITLAEWITKAIPSKRGMKLDFKSVDVLEPAFIGLNQSKALIGQPVWINADIFPGPNVDRIPSDPPVDPIEFKRLVLKYFPESTLSIGWTTEWENGGNNQYYTKEMIDKMAAYCKDFQQPITFPVRAAAVRKSWEHLSWLLKQSRAYTLTIWSGSTDNVSADDMVFVRQNSEADKVYYDLPKALMDEFLQKLREISSAVPRESSPWLVLAATCITHINNKF